MKYFKIYSNCVTRSNHINELSREEAYDIITNEAYNNEDYMVNPNWTFDRDEDDNITNSSLNEYLSYVTSHLIELFEEMNFIDCGDFRIVRLSDNEEPDVQNICGSSMVEFI